MFHQITLNTNYNIFQLSNYSQARPLLYDKDASILFRALHCHYGQTSGDIPTSDSPDGSNPIANSNRKPSDGEFTKLPTVKLKWYTHKYIETPHMPRVCMYTGMIMKGVRSQNTVRQSLHLQLEFFFTSGFLVIQEAVFFFLETNYTETNIRLQAMEQT